MFKIQEERPSRKGKAIVIKNYLKQRYDTSYREIQKLLKNNNMKSLFDVFRLLCKEPSTKYNVQKVKAYADAIGLDTSKLLWLDKEEIIQGPKGELIEKDPQGVMASENDQLNKNQICNVLQDLFEYANARGIGFKEALDIIRNDLNKLLKISSVPERIDESYNIAVRELTPIFQNNDFVRLNDIFRLLCKDKPSVFNVQKVRALGDVMGLNASGLNWINQPAVKQTIEGIILATEKDQENKNQICNIIQVIFEYMQSTGQSFTDTLNYFTQELGFQKLFPKKIPKKRKAVRSTPTPRYRFSEYSPDYYSGSESEDYPDYPEDEVYFEEYAPEDYGDYDYDQYYDEFMTGEGQDYDEYY